MAFCFEPLAFARTNFSFLALGLCIVLHLQLFIVRRTTYVPYLEASSDINIYIYSLYMYYIDPRPIFFDDRYSCVGGTQDTA